MDSTLNSISIMLLEILEDVYQVIPEPLDPETFLSKTAMDAAFRQGLFLSTIGRRDEEVEGATPPPLFMPFIHVNTHLVDGKLSGQFSFGGREITLTDVIWGLDYTIDEFSDHVTITNNSTMPPVIESREGSP